MMFIWTHSVNQTGYICCCMERRLNVYKSFIEDHYKWFFYERRKKKKKKDEFNNNRSSPVYLKRLVSYLPQKITPAEIVP